MKYDILVNKKNYLSKDYVPKRLIIINDESGNKLDKNYQNMLNKKAYKYFKKMQKEALNHNFKIYIDSSYRSFNYQKQIFDKCTLDKSYEYALKYVAKPGYSEHQTGLAIDVIIKRNKLLEDITGNEVEIKWLKINAYKYGFILRYPLGFEDITGYNYEPWHFRFVGKKVARKMRKNNIQTLEEYHLIKESQLR